MLKRGRKPNPVTIRGVEYPSQAAAAAALGVNPGTIHCAAKHGRLDAVGLGTNPSKPTTIRGVEYPSRRAAAQALGVSIGGISHAIRRGTLDCVGMGTRSPVVAARSEIERLRTALKDTTENGLLDWEPQTSRGAMNKAAMIERNRALYEGDA